MHFLNQSALWALLSLAAFLAVYFFKKKSKNVQVSSLMFFTTKGVPAEGGIEISRLQTPWILLLELLIVTLLVLSLCAPVILNKNTQVSLVLILDNSYSMSAQPPGEKSPLEKAKTYVKKELVSKNYYKVSLILSGIEPVILGKYEMEPSEANLYLDSWEGVEYGANITKALQLGREAFGKATRMVVLTDAMALDSEEVSEENILWLAFGVPMDNMAITGANRYSLEQMDRCFFEFSNFSKKEQKLEGVIKTQTDNKSEGKILQVLDVNLAPNQRHRVVLNFADQEEVICAEINSSDFNLDNRVCLEPSKRNAVKVRLNLSNPQQKKLMVYTINALGVGKIVEGLGEEDVLITDKEQFQSASWQLILPSSSHHRFVDGVIHRDTEHPLCMGLTNLRGLWAIDSEFKAQGKPLLSLGDIALLSVLQGGGHGGLGKKVYLNLNTSVSNITSTSFWPILFYNLLAWQQEESAEKISFRKGFSKSESSFLNLSSTELPKEVLSQQELRHFVNVSWWFVLAALILICLHAWLTGRRKGFVY